MNINFYGFFEFGDTEAVKQFVLAHYFTHEAESAALLSQFGTNIGTFNVSGMNAANSWIALMNDPQQPVSREMYDWLEAHNENHQAMLAVLGKNNVVPTTLQVDLSLVDLGDPVQMYDWLTLHQLAHTFEQAALKLS